jgi:hypothetical protein
VVAALEVITDCRPNLINIPGYSLGAISTTMAPEQVLFYRGEFRFRDHSQVEPLKIVIAWMAGELRLNLRDQALYARALEAELLEGPADKGRIHVARVGWTGRSSQVFRVIRYQSPAGAQYANPRPVERAVKGPLATVAVRTAGDALLIQDEFLQLVGQPPVSRILTLYGAQVGVVVLQGPDDPLDFLVVEVDFHTRSSRARIALKSTAEHGRFARTTVAIAAAASPQGRNSWPSKITNAWPSNSRWGGLKEVGVALNASCKREAVRAVWERHSKPFEPVCIDRPINQNFGSGWEFPYER